MTKALVHRTSKGKHVKSTLLAALAALLMGSTPAFADDPRSADRQQLLGILGDIKQGINEAKIELMTKHIDDTAVVTWLNAEVSTGPEGVRGYFARMVGNGPDAVLSKYATEPKIDQQARFYGDVAVANGTTEDEFTPHHRAPFRFSSRWTATLLKKDGEWKIISLNLSTNTFNNALTKELERYAIYSAAGGLAGGMLIVGLGCFIRRRKNG